MPATREPRLVFHAGCAMRRDMRVVYATLLALAVYTLGYLFWPALLAEPLVAGLRLLAWPALLVATMVAVCFRTLSPDLRDPLAGNEPRAFKINQRVLTNTVEQLAIFLPSFIALAASVDAAHTRLLPL